MDKDRVADILIEIGTLLELKGENPFKTRAYSNAAGPTPRATISSKPSPPPSQFSKVCAPIRT